MFFNHTPCWVGPAVAIVDERNVSVREAVFKSGALVRLVCQVRQADKDNFSLHWKIGQAILNHDTQRGGVRYIYIYVYYILSDFYFYFLRPWCCTLCTIFDFYQWVLFCFDESVHFTQRQDGTKRSRRGQLASHGPGEFTRFGNLHLFSRQPIRGHSFRSRHTRWDMIIINFHNLYP